MKRKGKPAGRDEIQILLKEWNGIKKEFQENLLAMRVSQSEINLKAGKLAEHVSASSAINNETTIRYLTEKLKDRGEEIAELREIITELKEIQIGFMKMPFRWLNEALD